MGASICTLQLLLLIIFTLSYLYITFTFLQLATYFPSLGNGCFNWPHCSCSVERGNFASGFCCAPCHILMSICNTKKVLDFQKWFSLRSVSQMPSHHTGQSMVYSVTPTWIGWRWEKTLDKPYKSINQSILHAQFGRRNGYNTVWAPLRLASNFCYSWTNQNKQLNWNIMCFCTRKS